MKTVHRVALVGLAFGFGVFTAAPAQAAVSGQGSPSGVHDAVGGSGLDLHLMVGNPLMLLDRSPDSVGGGDWSLLPREASGQTGGDQMLIDGELSTAFREDV